MASLLKTAQRFYTGGKASSCPPPSEDCSSQFAQLSDSSDPLAVSMPLCECRRGEDAADSTGIYRTRKKHTQKTCKNISNRSKSHHAYICYTIFKSFSFSPLLLLQAQLELLYNMMWPVPVFIKRICAALSWHVPIIKTRLCCPIGKLFKYSVHKI